MNCAWGKAYLTFSFAGFHGSFGVVTSVYAHWKTPDRTVVTNRGANEETGLESEVIFHFYCSLSSECERGGNEKGFTK